MMLLAQVPGADEVIESAADHGWEAVGLAIVLVTTIGCIGWMIRSLWALNERLATRVTNLETTIETKLIVIVERSVASLQANTTMMERAASAIEKLEDAVEHSLHTQELIVAKMETSPCLMASALSDETKQRLHAAQQAAVERAKKGDKRG